MKDNGKITAQIHFVSASFCVQTPTHVTSLWGNSIKEQKRNSGRKTWRDESDTFASDP